MNDATEVTVYRFAKNKREEVRATLGTFNDRDVVSLRVWANGKPTPKGLTLSLDKLPELVAAVSAIGKAAEARST